MTGACPLCGGACAGVDLSPLLDRQLAWLWEQVAVAADRRGDADLAAGTLQVRAPRDAEPRAAACGLVGGRVLAPEQTRRIDLSELTRKLRSRGPHLTPGAVAAHVVQRPLAQKAKTEAVRAGHERELQGMFSSLASSMPATSPVRPDPDLVWPVLSRNGWITRVLTTGDQARMFRSAVSVLSALPTEGRRVDRRRLASDSTGNPHALDEGATLAGLVLAILVAVGKVAPRQRPRAAWAQVGVDCDDVTGGLIAVGIFPEGWRVPPGATATITPRVLSSCRWSSPSVEPSWVFITENPSVASAAADQATSDSRIRLLCTSGTPAAREVAAVARLASAGWSVAVRADFDEAGLAHVSALLNGVQSAVPWRMEAEDYLASLASANEAPQSLDLAKLPASPWDPRLRVEMVKRRLAAFEESLLPELLQDLRESHPRSPRRTEGHTADEKFSA
jgi:uncharacterized protein (TIGR02679 family)